MKLVKIGEGYYKTADGYELKKVRLPHLTLKKLYTPSGECLGSPETLKDANEWIKEDRES